MFPIHSLWSNLTVVFFNFISTKMTIAVLCTSYGQAVVCTVHNTSILFCPHSAWWVTGGFGLVSSVEVPPPRTAELAGGTHETSMLFIRDTLKKMQFEIAF